MCIGMGQGIATVFETCVKKVELSGMKLCASLLLEQQIKISVFAPPCAGLFCAGVFLCSCQDDEKSFLQVTTKLLKGVVSVQIAVLDLIIKTL